MSTEQSIQEYTLIKPKYEALASKIDSLILDILEIEKIKPHGIFHRTKSVGSLRKKIEKKEYKDPLIEITDFCGVRIIAYVDDDVKRICSVIRDLFDIDESRSINKNVELGEDRVGYKSVHLICKLPGTRTDLPEYSIYKDLYFEVQVRTILQHSWAEIEHDKNYKFSGVLPTELKRRFMLLSGTLELVDREFNQLSIEIDVYSKSIKESTGEGNLDIPLNSISLIEFLSEKMKPVLTTKSLLPHFNGRDAQILKELDLFGIKTLADLDHLFPEKYLELTPVTENKPNNFLGLLRSLMIINNCQKYVDLSYQRDWVAFSDRQIQIMKKYKVDLTPIKQYLKIQP